MSNYLDVRNFAVHARCEQQLGTAKTIEVASSRCLRDLRCTAVLLHSTSSLQQQYRMCASFALKTKQEGKNNIRPLLLVNKECTQPIPGGDEQININGNLVAGCRAKRQCRSDEIPFHISVPGSIPGSTPRKECLPVTILPTSITEGSGFTVFEPTMLHVPTSLTNDDAVMRAHSFNPSELETESGPITVYRLSNASRCKMQSREGNYDLDYKERRYVSFIYVCWQRFNYCKVLNLEKSNAASSKQVSAHFVVEGAFEGAEDPRVFFFDGESYVLFNAPTKVKITDKSDITTRAMFISRLVGMEARATSIVLTESSFQTSAKNFIPLVTERTVFLVTALEPFEICELSFHVATFGVCKRKFVAVNESRTTYTNQLHGGQIVTTTSGYLAVVHYAVHGIFGRLYVHNLSSSRSSFLTNQFVFRSLFSTI